MKAAPATTGLWAVALVVTAVFMLPNSPTPLYVHWQQQLGFSSGVLTVIFALYNAGLLGMLLIASQLSDRYGRKFVLIAGLLATLVACLLFASAISIMMLVIGRLLAGIAVGVIILAGMAAVVDVGSSEHKRLVALLASVARVLGTGLEPLLPIFGIEAHCISSACSVTAVQPSGRICPHHYGPCHIRLSERCFYQR